MLELIYFNTLFISIMIGPNFACFNLSENITTENLLKSSVVTCLSLLGIFSSISSIFTS